MNTHEHVLDASGLNCPLPILRAKKNLNALVSGQILHVIATDPGAAKDFAAFCKQTDNQLVFAAEADGKFIFDIRKS